jgi:hypothetical protein
MSTRTTTRIAIATAALLAVMAPAAQAKPLGDTQITSSAASGSYVGTYRPTAPTAPPVKLVSDRADRIGVATPDTPSLAVPDRVDKIGTDLARPVVTPVFVTHTTTAAGFDWLDAGIGAATALALALIATAGMAARGRRHMPLAS